MPYVDVLIGIEPIHCYNEDGVTDVKDGLSMQPSFEDQDRVFRALAKTYNLKAIARTVRYAHSGSNNSLRHSTIQTDRLMRVSLSTLILLTVSAVEMHSHQVLYTQ